MKDAFVEVKYQEIKIKLDRRNLELREELPRYSLTEKLETANLAKELIGWFDREVMLVITLNTQFEIVGYAIAHMGTTSALMTNPKEIFKYAILTNASYIIIAHNHPSGMPIPSKPDIEVTERLFEASKVIQIEVLDHLIIGYKSFYSMKQRKMQHYK